MATGIRVQSRPRSQSPRLLLYSRAALFSFVAALAISIVASSGADTVSGRLGGDFPAFYAAGSIVADGDWADLYSADRQLEAQAELFGDTEGSYLYFAYPPHVAPLYRPLAAMDYRLAYTIHTIVMAAALVAAVALMRPMVGLVHRHFELVVTASLLFYPMLRAVTGGQNTALSLLALSATWRLLHDEQDLAAGLVLALLLYKPQLAVPLIGLVLVARRWRAVVGAVAGAGGVWGFGAVVMGADWVSKWWGEVSDFAAADADINGQNAISWLGFTEALLGSGTTAAAAVAAPLVAASVVGLVWLWARRDVDLAVAIAVVAVGIVMISPHAMFYDAGLLVIAGVIALDRLGSRAHAPVAAVWIGAWLQLFADGVGLAPLFFILVGAAAWLVPLLLAGPAEPVVA